MHFRNSQRSWIVTRHGVGGKVLVLARMDDALVLYSGIYAITAPSRPNADGKSFSVHVDDLPHSLYSCRKPFKWDEVRQKIFGPFQDT